VTLVILMETNPDYPSSKVVTPNHLSSGKFGSRRLYILVVRKTSVMPQL